MKLSSNPKAVTVTAALYNFYRSFIYSSIQMKEVFTIYHHQKYSSQKSTIEQILNQMKEIDEKVFDLLDNLNDFEKLNGSEIDTSYSDYLMPTREKVS